MFVESIVYLGFKAPIASQQGSVSMSGKHNQAFCGKCERSKAQGNEAYLWPGCFPVYLAILTVPNCFAPWRLEKTEKEEKALRENFNSRKLSFIMAAFIFVFTNKHVQYYNSTQ